MLDISERAFESERTDLALALDGVAEFVRRYVVLSDAQLCAVALWTLHTHAIDAAYTTPYLSITSAERSPARRDSSRFFHFSWRGRG